MLGSIEQATRGLVGDFGKEPGIDTLLLVLVYRNMTALSLMVVAVPWPQKTSWAIMI